MSQTASSKDVVIAHPTFPQSVLAQVADSKHSPATATINLEPVADSKSTAPEPDEEIVTNYLNYRLGESDKSTFLASVKAFARENSNAAATWLDKWCKAQKNTKEPSLLFHTMAVAVAENLQGVQLSEQLSVMLLWHAYQSGQKDLFAKIITLSPSHIDTTQFSKRTMIDENWRNESPTSWHQLWFQLSRRLFDSPFEREASAPQILPPRTFYRSEARDKFYKNDLDRFDFFKKRIYLESLRKLFGYPNLLAFAKHLLQNPVSPTSDGPRIGLLDSLFVDAEAYLLLQNNPDNVTHQLLSKALTNWAHVEHSYTFFIIAKLCGFTFTIEEGIVADKSIKVVTPAGACQTDYARDFAKAFQEDKSFAFEFSHKRSQQALKLYDERRTKFSEQTASSASCVDQITWLLNDYIEPKLFNYFTTGGFLWAKHSDDNTVFWANQLMKDIRLLQAKYQNDPKALHVHLWGLLAHMLVFCLKFSATACCSTDQGILDVPEFRRVLVYRNDHEAVGGAAWHRQTRQPIYASEDSLCSFTCRLWFMLHNCLEPQLRSVLHPHTMVRVDAKDEKTPTLAQSPQTPASSSASHQLRING